jgi:2-hydroxychromene-2-carboxylate isomerase
VLRKIADGVGLDGRNVLDVARNEEIALEFERYTSEAQERGVYGSPFYIFEGELFWGQDRLEFLEARLARASVDGRPGRIVPPTQGVCL